MPMLEALKNVMLNETVDIKVIKYIKAIAKGIGFDDILFVSTAGDNSNGSCWENAYTSITTALDWINANQADGESHLVMIGAGTFDINTTGDPEYRDLSIGMVGMGRGNTFISNDHASATSILKFDGCELLIASLCFYTGNNNITGLVLEEDVGGVGVSIIIDDVEFRVLTPTGAHSLLILQSDVEKLSMTNCWFYGNTTHTTAIWTDDQTYNYFQNIHISNCLVGIHMTDNDDRYNHFKDIYFDFVVTCIDMDGALAVSNFFENIYFLTKPTTYISDASSQTSYKNLNKVIPYSEQTEIYLPDDLTGVTITAGAGANTWSAADADVVAAATATSPYKLLGFSYECAATEKYAIRFVSQNGTDYAYVVLLEGTANVCKNYYFKEPIYINQGEALQASAKSETGGNNILVWAIVEMF